MGEEIRLDPIGKNGEVDEKRYQSMEISGGEMYGLMGE